MAELQPGGQGSSSVASPSGVSTSPSSTASPSSTSPASIPTENLSLLSVIHVPKPFQPRVSAVERDWAIQKVEDEEQEEQADHQSESENDSEYDKNFGTSDSDTSDDSERQFSPVAVIESLMKLVALEEVKEQFLDIKSNVETCRLQKVRARKQRFHAVFQGNPGTGMYNSPQRII